MGAKRGDLVTVDYVGRFKNGKVFDTSLEDVAKEAGVYNPDRVYEPLEFRLGSKSMIQGFQEAVVGMEMGETKKVEVPPEKAYGKRDPKKVKRFPLSKFKRQVRDFKVGHRFKINGKPAVVTGVDKGGGEVEVYFGNPMAGKTLVFEITVRKILRNPEKVQI